MLHIFAAMRLLRVRVSVWLLDLAFKCNGSNGFTIGWLLPRLSFRRARGMGSQRSRQAQDLLEPSPNRFDKAAWFAGRIHHPQRTSRAVIGFRRESKRIRDFVAVGCYLFHSFPTGIHKML